MELIKVPTADGDIHDDWKDIAEIAKLINALGDLKIVMSQVRNKLTLTTGSATLELMLGGGTGTAITYPWQPYLSSWTGSGTDPFAATRASRFRLRRGKFAGRTPANMSDEFVAFGDLTDATITEENAVVTQVYLSAPVTETTLGQGDATYAIPTIMVVQGADLLTALGTTLPNTGEDGALPANLIVPICEVSIWGGALHFEPGCSSYLDAVLSVTSGCQFETRQITPVGIIQPA